MTDRSRTLSQIADELESVKAEMEERGSSMTDGAPLVNIRKTLARMKQEVGIYFHADFKIFEALDASDSFSRQACSCDVLVVFY